MSTSSCVLAVSTINIVMSLPGSVLAVPFFVGKKFCSTVFHHPVLSCSKLGYDNPVSEQNIHSDLRAKSKLSFILFQSFCIKFDDWICSKSNRENYPGKCF